MLTPAQKKALEILKDTSYSKQMSPVTFAEKMWGGTDTLMFTKVKNSGNGACTGKGSWLCAGSYMGRLRKKGWVYVEYAPTGYYITFEGKKQLEKIN